MSIKCLDTTKDVSIIRSFFSDFTYAKAVNVLNAELSNTIGNLVNRGTVDKLNPRQTYPKFDEQIFESDLKELGQSLIDSLNKLNGKYLVIIMKTAKITYMELRFFA